MGQSGEAKTQKPLGLSRSAWDLPFDPTHDHVDDIALLGRHQLVTTPDLMVSFQTATAAGRGRVLRDEHWVTSVGRLSAVTAGLSRCYASRDQFLGVTTGRFNSAQMYERPLAAMQVKARAKWLFGERVQPLIDRLDCSQRRLHLPATVAPGAASTSSRTGAYDDPMHVVEFGQLTDSQQAELEGDEVDPFDAGDSALRWRAKDRHVALRGLNGRLVACAGLVIADVQVDYDTVIPVVGLGGVIVSAQHRGQGLGNRIVAEALDRAARMGPAAAMLFCHRDRAGLYARHGFVEIVPPVLVRQPGGLVQMPLVTMWRALSKGGSLPSGRLILRSLPF